MKKLLLLLFLFVFPVFLIAKDKPFTSDLDGLEITYTYSEGGSYNLKYTSKGVMYRYLSGDAPDEWWGPFPYKAFRTQNGEYFLGWYEKGYGDYITQLVNLKTMTLYGSGLIVKRDRTIEHFQIAKIEKLVRKPTEK